ncbi:DUF2189 domain-containing protein [Candidatus Thiothrix sp. Deng01]|uniref:DUF2189 domain-containing protein n=1 Tax=Candidatus Thiothrix phosphatis TaxID=3112415 RepID=A0ABU6CSV6_9GAMM|nr:DUF2189 domain-containing protein [Candidatus Thiothrix sp. Deng01]MEB4589607.1 DUF2189 domain-containing protein [Candidatus Thiothrix sp. Deng01]
MEQFVSKPSEPSMAPDVDHLFKSYPVQKVGPGAIRQWLGQGWEDLKVNPSASLSYGIIFALVGVLMSMVSAGNPAFFVAATTGFFLVGPFLALGLYALSHQIEQGWQPRLLTSMFSIRENAVSLGFYAVLLGMLMIFWVRVAALITGIFFNDMSMSVSAMGYTGLWNALMGMDDGGMFVLSFFGVGLLFALVAFVTGVVTAPMLLERKVDIVTAAATSVRAVMKNPVTMLVWAATITAIVGIGILTFNIGLIIAMPLVAHASWHAYRALVKEE